MPIPRRPEARTFYRAGKQRFEDARFLFAARRTTGAIYLAGYCIECMLKAMILSTVTDAKIIEIIETFRGSKAHDFVWLKTKYIENGGAAFPKALTRNFSFVNTWAVEMRYKPGTAKYEDAKSFLNAAQEIMIWSDGRM